MDNYKEEVMNYCPNCGKKNAGDRYCAECGTKLLIRDSGSRNTVSVLMRRDSVCMGDDCMAPHETETVFEPSDTLYDLLRKAAEYVPPMHDFEWEIMCDADVIGRLTSGAEKKYQIKLEYPDIKISSLPEKEIFCRKCYKT